ncbi:hypothetical protein IU474_25970 [Nocardia otitidiscaviarum]|uniref:hypothetical protein n=1 Tax=Nocardia otitidiscaviarum TaxID=1823 RepID=UPI001895C320|nr:hypothetical protein [Nocardia otitidiscaviarum]MBF6240496.1 hypothetical protein [Nocardia otitidiscaviarum]
MSEQWHFIITLTWCTRIGVSRTAAVDGTVDLTGTRQEAFQGILRRVRGHPGFDCGACRVLLA